MSDQSNHANHQSSDGGAAARRFAARQTGAKWNCARLPRGREIANFFWPVATSAAGERRSYNSCEADVNVLGTIGWDLGRFGIQFVASPRQADSLLIAGGVSDNM